MSTITLPQNRDTEKALLSAILIDPQRVLALCVKSGFKPAWLVSPDHSTIYEGIIHLQIAGEPIDFITLTNVLRDTGELERCGGAAYSTDLFTYVPTAANVGAYLDTLRECYAARELMTLGGEIMSRATADSASALLVEFRDRVADLYARTTPNPGESLFANVGAILDAGIKPERPSIVRTVGGRHLLYAGRINEAHAEPSLGKTNLCCIAAIETMRDGGHVLYLDPEDTPNGIIGRLLAFGASAELLRERFHYIQNPTPEQYTLAHGWAAEQRPALVILDGLAEAFAAEGLDENIPADVLQFFRQRIRPFTDAGAAVFIADHVAKNADERGRWARGSGAKLGRYDGVSYAASVIEGYSPTKAGAIRLSVAKDRNGGIGVTGETVAELHLTPTESGTAYEFREAGGSSFIPTVLMDRVRKHLAHNPGASKSELRELGKGEYVDEAITQLIKADEIKRQDGARGRHSYYLKEVA